MTYKRLFIWVEGNDDERLFTKIIKPIFQNSYNWIEVRPYANMKKGKLINYLVSIQSMNADYIYVSDINNSPCITAKKQKIKDKYPSIDESRIAIIVREIESWYLAGLNNNESKNLKIKMTQATDDITKEQFDQFQPKQFESRIDFMLEILNRFSIDTAKQKNTSFGYFLRKYCESIK